MVAKADLARSMPIVLPRGRLVLLLLLAGVVLPVGVGYRTLCAGPASAYTAMASARNEARGGRAVPASGGLLGSVRAEITGVWVAALDGALAWKQDDRVAFPAHVVAGYAVELGPCSAEARADQWRKAAKHAWGHDQAALAADGLRRTAGPTAALAALRADAGAEPWFTPNLDRVAAALLS